MRLVDIVDYSFKSLRHRQMRSWLTILGIVIGIAAVVSLLTIGQGFNDQVIEQLSGFGSNQIYIIPYSEEVMRNVMSGGGGGLPPTSGKLLERDVQRLEKIPEVTNIGREVERRATVGFKGEKITNSINGIQPSIYEEMTLIEVEKGRFLLDSDRRMAVIGPKFAEEAFGTRNPVSLNDYIEINGVKVRVAGILKKSSGGIMSALDNAVMVPYADAKEMFKSSMGTDEMDGITLQIAEGTDETEVTDAIYRELDASHKVKAADRDYSVISPDTIRSTVNEVLSLVTIFIGAVASISLLVGGLAIASAMFTSVIERTHEIGILKAVGAKSGDIKNIFLFESGAMGAVGGIAGTALGLVVVYIASLFGLPFVISWPIVAFGVLFAFFVGLASGYFPAKKAASLAPVEALRYE